MRKSLETPLVTLHPATLEKRVFLYLCRCAWTVAYTRVAVCLHSWFCTRAHISTHPIHYLQINLHVYLEDLLLSVYSMTHQHTALPTSAFPGSYGPLRAWSRLCFLKLKRSMYAPAYWRLTKSNNSTNKSQSSVDNSYYYHSNGYNSTARLIINYSLLLLQNKAVIWPRTYCHSCNWNSRSHTCVCCQPTFSKDYRTWSLDSICTVCQTGEREKKEVIGEGRVGYKSVWLTGRDMGKEGRRRSVFVCLSLLKKLKNLREKMQGLKGRTTCI